MKYRKEQLKVVNRGRTFLFIKIFIVFFPYLKKEEDNWILLLDQLVIHKY